MECNLRKALMYWGIALLILLTLFPLAGAENLYDSVIRIHILANSDSPEDQELKLAVRDEILQYAEDNFPKSTSREVAEEALEAQLEEIATVAEQVLAGKGCPEKVEVSLSEEYYPTREYEGLSLPQGQYLSLQVKIGSAEGQNWWCILFPPVCTRSAMAPEDALAEVGMNEENIKTVIGEGADYRYRFRCIELWEGAKKKFQSLF